MKETEMTEKMLKYRKKINITFANRQKPTVNNQ